MDCNQIFLPSSKKDKPSTSSFHTCADSSQKYINKSSLLVLEQKCLVFIKALMVTLQNKEVVLFSLAFSRNIVSFRDRFVYLIMIPVFSCSYFCLFVWKPLMT